MENVTPNCEHCRKPILQAKDICPSCGFPIDGTDVQKEIFYYQLESKKGALKDLRNKVENARVTLWIIAALSFLFAVITFFVSPASEFAFLIPIIHLVIGIIFLLLSSYALDKPFTALIMAAVIYLAFLLYRIIEGESVGIFQWFGRAVIIGFLIKGAISAQEAEDLKKEIK